MEIQKKIMDNIPIISIEGRLDAYTSVDLEESINELIDAGNLQIIVNFDKIDYISSSGLRVMLATLKQLKQVHGDVKLCCLKSYIREIFDIAGFTQLFEIYEKEDDAFKSFK